MVFQTGTVPALKPKASWKRYVPGILITILWLGMMASLFYHHVLPPRHSAVDESDLTDSASLTRRWRDTGEFMLLTYNKAIIGAASTIVQKVDAPQVHYVANFRLGASLGFARLKQNISVKAVGELDSKFELNGFFVDANFAALRLRVRGATKGTELFLDVERNGQHALSRLQLGRRISLLEAVRPALMQRFRIRPGATYVLPVADPMFSMQQGQVEVRVLDPEKISVGGREREAYKVEMRLNDFVTNSWVDRQGNTLRRQVIGNLAMEATSEVDAKKTSSVLTEPMELPELDLGQFNKVPSRTVEQMADDKNSPLGALGGLLKGD